MYKVHMAMWTRLERNLKENRRDWNDYVRLYDYINIYSPFIQTFSTT